MTLSEFLSELEQYDLNWFIFNEEIRTNEYCPLTAVCHKKLGCFYGIEDYDIAGSVLDLSKEDIHDIAIAADDPDSPLRESLIKAIKPIEKGK